MVNLRLKRWPVAIYSLILIFFAVATRAQSPALTLADAYEEGVPLHDYWVSEKLDGVRAYWNGDQLISRQGNVFHPPVWFTADFPEQPLDGELWMGRGQFAEVSGTVRTLEPVAAEWREVRYRIFDLPASEATFSQRVRQMRNLLMPSPSPYLAIIEQVPATTHKALMAQLDRIVGRGGEGLMLHRGDSLYRAGRSDDLLKVKRRQDAEAVVVGQTEGKGKYRGMLGALIVERPDGRRFRLGTGFTDAERKHPPSVGSTVTYQYFGYTATGLPRFASFMRVRKDEPVQK